MHLLSDTALTQLFDLLALWFWHPAAKHEEATVMQTYQKHFPYQAKQNPQFLCWTAALYLVLISSKYNLCLPQCEIRFIGWLEHCDLSFSLTCPACT
jgi:hypothetical protein